jgi:hypothetical protein
MFVTVIVGLFAASGGTFGVSAHAADAHMSLNCALKSTLCTEVAESEQVFGEDVYIGHDEPSNLFYSNVPGAGNRMLWQMTLPKDPAPTPLTAGKSFNFQLHPAFWFGMAMCDTQSYPEQLSTCTPDSDNNIVDPAVSAKHPGAAFMEMQFYPPGWAPWPAGTSCDATKWCAALNIDSLSQNPITGQSNNAACLNVAGIEPVNFAFITKNGQAQAPANPVNATAATFTPNAQQDLFMNSGDRLTTVIQDTAHGLRIDIFDISTGQHGSMTSSAANTFGQVKFDPAGTTCQNIPYDFHPMYSTSSEQTRVPWAAHSYNIAFSDEIGHFDYCSNVTTTGGCSGTEGATGDTEPTDVDDVGCFPASASTLVQVSGCSGTNTGFDGVPYQTVWPDGNTALHPTAVRFTSPLTGSRFNTNYNRTAFEADLPRVELNTCNRTTGAGCTLIPMTDDNAPANFYPFYSIRNVEDSLGLSADRVANWEDHTCTWALGNHIPGSTNDFGRNDQYGALLPLTYTGLNGVPIQRFNDFRQVFHANPCPIHLLPLVNTNQGG